MFTYSPKQRRTAKFLAAEKGKIEQATAAVLTKYGATAEIAKAGVEKWSNGGLYARVTLRNGSGPTPVAPILAELKTMGIIATPTTTESSGGMRIESFTIFAPEESWTNTTTVAEHA